MQNELNSNVARFNQLTHESCFHDTMFLVRVKVALTFPFETVCYRPSDFFSKTSKPSSNASTKFEWSNMLQYQVQSNGTTLFQSTGNYGNFYVQLAMGAYDL